MLLFTWKFQFYQTEARNAVCQLFSLESQAQLFFFGKIFAKYTSLNNHVISSKTGVPGNKVASLTQQLKQLPKWFLQDKHHIGLAEKSHLGFL